MKLLRPSCNRDAAAASARAVPRRRLPPRTSPTCSTDRKSTRLNSSHPSISYAVFCLKKKIPGLYGMFHAKWLTKIEATQGEYLAYWQQKGWTNRGLIHTTAIIATPVDSKVVSGIVLL